jgi:HEAT repeat protein
VLRRDDEVGRRNAALALARIGPSAHEAVPALKDALWDDDRYVRGKAVEALNRIGTPDAHEPLIDYLMTSRWCDLTTADSLY